MYLQHFFWMCMVLNRFTWFWMDLHWIQCCYKDLNRIEQDFSDSGTGMLGELWRSVVVSGGL